MTPPTLHFCTYFDRNYLAQGLTLYRSLSRHAGPFRLWVLCLDETTYGVLAGLNLDDLRPVSLREFEEGDELLRDAKQNRSRIEYIFTCTPSWPRYLLHRHPEMDLISFLDADLLFYSDPAPLYGELGEGSVLIVGHRFPERLRHEEVHGIYNVGLLIFRNDDRGRQVLDWWRERCLEWCRDRVEPGRYADQKYLDDWPARFPGVAVLRHKGGGLAPWNYMRYRIHAVDGTIFVDDQELIFFHYQGFKILSRRLLITGADSYEPMPRTLTSLLYDPYIRSILETERWASGLLPQAEILHPATRSRSYPIVSLVRNWLRNRIVAYR